MRPLGNPNRHVLLVNGMAKSIGADLTAAQKAGVLDQADYAGMVQRCRGCAEPTDCESRLRSPDGVDQTPSYCRNADILAKLVP